MRLRRSLPVLLALLPALACVDAPRAEGRDAGLEPGDAAARGLEMRPALDSARLAVAYARAAELPPIRSLLVEWRGRLVGERYFNGTRADATANMKSASKSVIAALVGIAIERGHIGGVDATLGELLRAETRGLDSARRAITVEDLLTMRTGLRSTSFDQYGAFVTSRNWVRHALTQPVVAERGGPMIYSTGSSHLLSAALTRATGTSTWAFARRELAPLGIRLRPWTTDPQGVYFGGNEMRMTPREMLAFGRLYLRDGRADDGTQLLPRDWVRRSWTPRTTSSWSGHAYGYGWWIRETQGHPVYFAWGYGGQYIFVVPSLDLLVVATSDPEPRTRDRGHLSAIHALLDDFIVPAVAQ